MTRPPVVGGITLAKALRELLSSDQAIVGDGVGGNLIEVLADLARAANRLAEAVERFCDLNDQG